MSWIEWIAVATTLLAVYLTTRQIVWCWPLGMISVTLYAWVFYVAKLYADMGLQTLYLALAAYGWWAWTHGSGDRGELPVSTTPTSWRFILLAIGTVGGITLGSVLSRHTDASLPFMDSTLTSFSVVAQWMQTRKLLEAWLVWLAVDIFYVGMFLYKKLYPTAGLYIVFLYLAVLGFIAWRRSMPDSAPPKPARSVA